MLTVFSDRFSPTGKALVLSDELFAGEGYACHVAIGATRLACIVATALRERLDSSLNYAALLTEQPNAPK